MRVADFYKLLHHISELSEGESDKLLLEAVSVAETVCRVFETWILCCGR